MFIAVLIPGLLIWLAACQRAQDTNVFSLKPNLPEVAYDYTVKMPTNFSQQQGKPVNFFVQPNGDTTFFFNNINNGPAGFQLNPSNPKITNAGATLGRVLFYDPQLSLNNSISCASCHHQERSFSDGEAASTGFAGKVTPRNSMAIVNSGFNNNLFWDSRVNSVHQLVTQPIQNHIEMGMEDMPTLVNKLAQVDYYKPLFKAAFPNGGVTEQNISSALAQFVSSITAGNTRFDEEQKKNFAGFTTMEKMGRDLFFSTRTNCNRCHTAPNFSAPDFPGGEYGSSSSFNGDAPQGTANTGLDLRGTDGGRSNGKFRIPTLRNIALTAPYMHDGRFATLEAVIDHYSTGMKAHPNLDKNLRNADGTPKRMRFNTLEQQALVAFLHTLTDKTMQKDQRFSNPFN